MACVTGRWGEQTFETGNYNRSELATKNAQSPSRPMHVLLRIMDFKYHACLPHTWPEKAKDHQQPSDDRLQLAIFQVAAPSLNVA